MSELLSCPFCGGEAQVLKDGLPYVVIECERCFCRTNCNVTEAEAIAVWNTRAVKPCYATDRTYESCKYSVNRGWIENVDLGNGTCHIEESNGDWYCDACGEMVGTFDPTSELFIDGNAVELWNYCPNCGAKVVGE